MGIFCGDSIFFIQPPPQFFHRPPQPVDFIFDFQAQAVIVAQPFIHHSGLKEGFVFKKCVRQKLADEALLDLMFHPC